jgi:5-methyltetrahydrofolate--homocysteine methyltransferase
MLETIYQSILHGGRTETVEMITKALCSNHKPGEILKTAMIPAMYEVGNQFERGNYFVPEMLVSAKAMQEGLKIIKPLLSSSDAEPLGIVVAGTVKGDIHDIGKNLVCMMMEGSGFEVYDLGTNVHPETFVDVVKKKQPTILALSALLTTTMPNLKLTIDTLIKAGVRDGLWVMVGGAPVTAEFAKSIGADGFAEDASRAVSVAKHLIGV